jgi:16S rRNA processing protein RimM
VDERGQTLGAVAEIYQTGANDIYTVRDGDREFLLPALRTVILEVDLPGRRMKVRPPDGTTA